MIQTLAPAKLVILGEYAVLDGAPALVQAIDRYAKVQVSASESGRHEVMALPLMDAALPFRFDNEGRFRWLDDKAHQLLPFVQPLMEDLGPWGEVRDANGQALSAMRVTLDTQAFFSEYQGERRKLGLGSSAALAVSLAAAWYASRHQVQALDVERWLPTLVDLHRKLQNGKGSGVDVAASLYGGLIEYQVGNQLTGEDYIPPSAQAIPTPKDVEWMWIWLGQAASTRDFLNGMSVFREHRAQEYQSHMAELTQLSQDGVAAAHAGDSDALLQGINDYGLAMQRLGEAAHVPIYTDGHRRLAQLAKRFNVAFKPSGAGGGDIALAASRDTEALSDLARQVHAAGYPVVALGPATHGLSIRSGSE